MQARRLLSQTIKMALSRYSLKGLSTQRFFKSKVTSVNLHRQTEQVNARPNPETVKQMVTLKEEGLREIQRKYPHLLCDKLTNQLAYTLQPVSPVTMIKNGGLHNIHNLWVSNTESGNNEGSICLSLLPQVPLAFLQRVMNLIPKNEVYLYAFALTGTFVFPGSKWREVISPRALPLSSYWVARQVLDFDPQTQAVQLGKLIGQTNDQVQPTGEAVDQFVNNQLVKPTEIDLGEDYPLEHIIDDTPATEAWQESVTRYYRFAR